MKRVPPAGATRLPGLHLAVTPEGQILLCALFITLLYLAWLGANFIFWPAEFKALVGITATHVLFGRAAGMSFGYSLGYGHALVFTANVIIETILVMVFYPLFVFSMRSLLVIPRLKTWMERTYEAARSHRPMILRWGIVGIFLFVLLPFWGTGPVVGSVIGYLLRFHAWATMAVVLTGTYAACALWAVLLKGLHDRIGTLSPYAGIGVVGAIILLVILGYVVAEFRKRRKSPGDGGDGDRS